MNAEDTALCQQAIELANSGQKQAAYEQFCMLHNKGNTEDTTVLSWIAYTTPSLDDAHRAIATIARLEPDHPRLDYLRNYVSRRQQRGVYAPLGRMGPVLQCPYCHYTGPVRVAQKVSVGGWIFLVLFLSFFLIGLLGLLFTKNYYVCSSCGIALGDVS
jgi:hypothetical protein